MNTMIRFASLGYSRRGATLCLLTIVATLLTISPAVAQEAEWIWAHGAKKSQAVGQSCYFRKSFQLGNPEQGQMFLRADDQYQLYVNGRKVIAGDDAQKLHRVDIGSMLKSGKNVIAIAVQNTEGNSAGLAVRLMVKQHGKKWVNHSTDETWKASSKALPFWNMPVYGDSSWAAATSFGPLGETAPWDSQNTQVQTVAARTPVAQQTGAAPTTPTRSATPAIQARTQVTSPAMETQGRFQINQEFEVSKIAEHEQVGSVIALAFNEFGHLLLSKEGGTLSLMYDSNNDGALDKVREYCDVVENIQGILPLNGKVFVTGDGPDGSALYRLSDTDRDGKLEKVETIVEFEGQAGEHGPHGITLGPDGLIYVVVGNHAAPSTDYAESSPYRNFYEGDLLPRYEDPSGHAAGVKAPGGSIIRTNTNGENIEIVAGGLRNAYDLAFDRSGELFVHDSDHEADMGSTWYRPTRLYHVIPGAEFGWRSGWAKWPEYYIDALPPVIETGRGSPTGMAFYNHVMFPARYHNALFVGDWSEGRIMAIHPQASGGTFAATAEVFLQGAPLNVTDLAVGPDGAVYFATGGRGTRGGVYRIKWKGSVPAEVTDFGVGVTKAIRYPQLDAAWARQVIAAERKKIGKDWNDSIRGVVTSDSNPAEYRIRALHLMQLFGPKPTSELLVDLSKSDNLEVRAEATSLLGRYSSEASKKRLQVLLRDESPQIRRLACEALARAGGAAQLNWVAKVIGSEDRYEAFAGRKLLERLDPSGWKPFILETEDHRQFNQGSVALLAMQPTAEHAHDVIDRAIEHLDGFISDDDFIDLLRVIELALIRGDLQADEVALLADVIDREYPSKHTIMNRELVRIMAFLEIDTAIDRYVAQLKSDAADIEKLHLAFQLRFIETGWTGKQKINLLRLFHDAHKLPQGGSMPDYIRLVSRDFAKTLTAADAIDVLRVGHELPSAALGSLYTLPAELDTETFEVIVSLSERLIDRHDENTRQLKVGLVAILARDGSAEAMQAIRKVWLYDPELRRAAAMALAQSPDGENWSYLLKSLPVLEGGAAVEVLTKLKKVNQAPDETENPEVYRQVILCGLKLKENGGHHAVALLEHWTTKRLEHADDEWQPALADWQIWYSENFPAQPKAELPVLADDSKYEFEELLTFLESDTSAGADVERGKHAFIKADCAKCHKYGGHGDTIGPDLTSISRRFSRREILEAILFPSHVIPDRYIAKTVATVDGKIFTGIVAPTGNGETVILQTNGEKVTLANDDIIDTRTSKKSAMPDGLLNRLEQQEIADLFEYLRSSTSTAVTRLPDGNATK